MCPLLDKYSSSGANKRQKLAVDFLGSIDQTGEFLALLEDDESDEVKQERIEVSERTCARREQKTTSKRESFCG